MLSAFVVAQIVFDVAVVALAAVYLLTRQPPRAPEPPEWYAHFLKLAQDLMAATEPVLERLEMGGSGRPPSPPTLRARNESGPSAGAGWAHAAEPAFDWRTLNPGPAATDDHSSTAPPARAAATATAPATPTDRYEKARALLRQGVSPDDVAGHIGLQPGELRLLTRIVAAESRPRSR
jgi:hypothetical protein